MKVGFIGLGVMGRPMALHVQRAGHALHIWARRPESVAGLPATICATPAELGRQCEVVFTVITSSADVEAVALGAGVIFHQDRSPPVDHRAFDVLWARRSNFSFGRQRVLVTEVFSPSLAT